MSKKVYSREEVFSKTLEYFNGDELATNVWINKYALKDSEGNLYEVTPDDMHHRMAKEFNRIERQYDNVDISKKNQLSSYGQNREKLSYDRIYEYFKNFKDIVPQGSVMSSLGDVCRSTINSII